jgi:ATP-dependent helicase/nuclease subunit A
LPAQLANSQGSLAAGHHGVVAQARFGLLPLQDELRALHIPAQIGEKTDLIDCCEVLDIVALLDVLVSPQHDLSLARVLKSPLFGLPR